MTNIIFRQDAVRQYPFCQEGKKALIVTGRQSARRCGALDDVTEALKAGGIDWFCFEEVEENPSVQTAEKAALLGRENGCDFIIGIGGGSPMDAAKAIALMMAYPQASLSDLYDKEWTGRIRYDLLPAVICIPTTCGTGSEVTGVSVLTRTDLKTKMSLPARIFPKAALLDDRYLLSAPLSLLQDTAMDALAHFLESYINTAATPDSQALVLKGLRQWARGAKGIFTEEPDKEALPTMLQAANAAGLAIALTGTTLPHGLSYRATVGFHLPHGRAVGFFQAGYLSQAEKTMRETLLLAAGFSRFSDFETFIHTYGSLAVKEEEKEALAQTIRLSAEEMLESPDRLKRVPFTVTRPVMMAIIGMKD